MKKVLFVSLCIILSGCATVSPLTGEKLYRGYQDDAIRRHTYVAEHPEIGGLKQTILDGKLKFGMSKEEVIASYGRPNKTNRTVVPGLIREQWVYGYYGAYPYNYGNIEYLYFENGILTAKQD